MNLRNKRCILLLDTANFPHSSSIGTSSSAWSYSTLDGRGSAGSDETEEPLWGGTEIALEAVSAAASDLFISRSSLARKSAVRSAGGGLNGDDGDGGAGAGPGQTKRGGCGGAGFSSGSGGGVVGDWRKAVCESGVEGVADAFAESALVESVMSASFEPRFVDASTVAFTVAAMSAFYLLEALVSAAVSFSCLSMKNLAAR